MIQRRGKHGAKDSFHAIPFGGHARSASGERLALLCERRVKGDGELKERERLSDEEGQSQSQSARDQ